MRILLLACLICINFYVHAQDSVKIISPNKDTFTSVQVEARFPGGQDAWRSFLETHIHASVAAKHKAPAGNYTVAVSFLVDKEGKVSDITVLKDPGYGTADDVLKAFKHTPDWLPATINGKPVIYRQKQNITYQVTEK